jgi:ankyrin repeat protein
MYLEIENKERKTALSIACEYGNRNLVNILLRFQANINHYMSIHMAVKSGNVDIVQLLIEYQVKLTSINQCNETPLHIACKYNRTDVLQVLIHHQKDLEIRDYRGYTSLLTAGYFDHQDCLRILLIRRADITAIDKYGRNIRKYEFLINWNDFLFVTVHICLEQNCPNALRTCLEWIENDIHKYHIFIQGDRHGSTVLHAGIYYSIQLKYIYLKDEFSSC